MARRRRIKQSLRKKLLNVSSLEHFSSNLDNFFDSMNYLGRPYGYGHMRLYRASYYAPDSIVYLLLKYDLI